TLHRSGAAGQDDLSCVKLASCQPSGKAGHFILPNHGHTHLTFAASCLASGAFLYLIQIKLLTSFGCADRGLVDVNKPAAFPADHFQLLSVRQITDPVFGFPVTHQ
ncbi:hypothetical protein, partial [Pseudochrobactrum sp. B5]|uniref:hypothetical protein n=1 Tax=Pseudochrobactrum sp. B5 TaxID=1289478 RepID=UPI001AECB0B5